VNMQTNAVLNNSSPKSMEITITLSPQHAEYLKDHTFWTGESPEQLLRRLYATYTKPSGEGEDYLWGIARSPQKRAAAFKRNKLRPKEIASLNQTLNAAILQLRQVWERETVKALKRMPVHKRPAFLRNMPPDDVARFLTLAAS
jgi:hypothetical protein